MAKKQENNFKKAMNELLGADTQNYKPGTPMAEPAKEQPVVTPEVKKAEPTINNLQKEPIPEKPIVREEAIIPADMTISGNITTKSNMKIHGNIIGDVECEGNILLLGKVSGNVSTGNLTIQNGELTGDATVKDNLVIEMSSTIIGNVVAQNVYSNARIEGQINAAATVELKEDALVQGDIIAGNISIKSGAKIKGMVTISE